MKRFTNLFLLLLPLLLSCCGRHGVVDIRIVATSDVHGQVFDIDAVTGKQREGSLAKVATFLSKERKEHRNVVYVDCGDILQGSIEMYRDVTAEFYKPSLAATAYNLLDCQAYAMGNHDLFVGTNSYDRFFRSLESPVLWGNLGFAKMGDYMPPYRVVEVGGVRIAFLGLTTQSVLNTIPADVMGELGVCSFEKASDLWIPVLRDEEKADVIVGLVHAGIKEWGNTPGLGGFDLILYGHDHERNAARIAVGNGDSVWVANPGAFCSSVAVADISLDFSKSDTPEPVISAGIEDIGDVEPDAKFLDRLSDRWDDVCAYADSTLGILGDPLIADGSIWAMNSSLDYIHSIQMGFQGAQVSLASCVQTTARIDAGPFTMRDAFHLYPFDNSMVSLMLSGAEIRSILECSTDRFLTEGPVEPSNRFLSAAGIKYVIDLTEPFGQRVKVISMSDGTPFDEEQMYRTTITSFLFGGTESVLPQATGLSGADLQTRLNVSTPTDIRYYVITQFALSSEMGDTVKIKRYSDWMTAMNDMVEHESSNN